jgi:hypothetical protein
LDGFSTEEIEHLAWEHDRWVEERSIKQPGHPDVRPWEGLSAEREKRKK